MGLVVAVAVGGLTLPVQRPPLSPPMVTVSVIYSLPRPFCEAISREIISPFINPPGALYPTSAGTSNPLLVVVFCRCMGQRRRGETFRYGRRRRT